MDKRPWTVIRMVLKICNPDSQKAKEWKNQNNFLLKKCQFCTGFLNENRRFFKGFQLKGVTIFSILMFLENQNLNQILWFQKKEVN